jgi:tetratricopeptide (TPR) repeat protein
MLDLSYEDIRSALVEAGKRPIVSYSEIAPITAEDLAMVGGGQGGADADPVQIAVLPYQPLSRISFDPQLDTVQIATAIRHRLEQVSGVRVKSPVDVRRQLRRLRAEGLSDAEQLRGITARLAVDFVVWGQVESPSEVRTAAYRRSDGQSVITVASARDPNQVAEVFLQAASKRPEQSEQESSGLDALARRIVESTEQSPLSGNVAKSPAVQSEILAAMEALQQAVGYEAGSEVANKLLDVADRSIQSAIRSERRNALAHWLSANILMNRATANWAAGNGDAAAKQISEMRSALRNAKRESRRNLSPSMQLEVEADEALLVRGDYVTAVEKYQELAAEDQPLASQLRAHWMLAGLHSGDWGASEWATANKGSVPQAADLVDAKQVRAHAIEILSRWSDSPQADLLRRWLRWDETAQRTQFHHFPRSNDSLAKLGGE